MLLPVVSTFRSKPVGQPRWAPVIGLVAQPFWLYAAWKAEQCGIAALELIHGPLPFRVVWRPT